MFLAPIAGETLCALLRRAAERDNDWLRALAGAAIVVASAVFVWQMRAMQRAYPNTASVLRVMQAEITPESTILSEDAYLFRYAFFPTIPTKNIEEMTWFDNILKKVENCRYSPPQRLTIPCLQHFYLYNFYPFQV